MKQIKQFFLKGESPTLSFPCEYRYNAVTETITCVHSNRVEEVYYVKLTWVKVVQKSLQLMDNTVCQLNVYVDNNDLLSCGGRISNTNVPYPVDTNVFKTSSGRLTKVTTSYDQIRRRRDVWQKTSDLQRFEDVRSTTS